jgi:predicted dehydrogenase
MDKIRWGILGTGGIAGKFAEALTLLPDAQITAVGSRSQASADAFGQRWSIPHRHKAYAALAEDKDVDVIYVSTPHPFHHENTMTCLRAGKPVLCEKPFAMNAKEAAEMVAFARERRLFLMEGMWTRYFPAIKKVRSLIAEGVLGEVRLAQVDFSFMPKFDPAHRLFDPALGGGALLDLGIYPISLAYMVFGESPSGIASHAWMGTTGVDEQSAVILSYPGGRQAVLSFGFRFDSAHEAFIFGDAGRIRIQRDFWHPDAITWTKADEQEEIFHLPATGNGFPHEAQEVADCLRAGQLESAGIPLDETILIMRTLDDIRAQWGLRYPTDPK